MIDSLVFVLDRFKVGGVEKVFINLSCYLDRKIVLLPLHQEYDDHMIKQLPDNVMLDDSIVGLDRSSLDILRLHRYSKIIKDKYHNSIFINFSDTLSSLLLTYFIGGDKSVSWIHCSPYELLSGKSASLYFYILGKCKNIIFICEEQRKTFFQLKNSRKIKKDKAVVCINFVDENIIWRLTKEKRTISDRYILMVSRIDFRTKDFYTLVDAFELYKDNNKSEYKLVIAGEGQDRRLLEGYIDGKKYKKDILLLGNVYNPYELMHNCELLVHSSKSEGFSMVVEEALLCGCKVVATNCEVGPSEILVDGLYGELVTVGNVEEMASAIERTINNTCDKDSLIGRGVELVNLGKKQISGMLGELEKKNYYC